jgi:TonB-dependent Receptor Plug Domain
MTHALPRAGVRRLRPQLIALAAASLCSAAFAQEAAKPADKSPEMKELEAVVVTGTARREGVRKLEAGFSITTATEEQIKQAAPTSTADILKTVPGVFVETSGGQAGRATAPTPPSSSTARRSTTCPRSPSSSTRSSSAWTTPSSAWRCCAAARARCSAAASLA